MKRKLALFFSVALATGVSNAESLYYVGSESQESMPLKWVVGMDLSYDDNVNPGYGEDGSAAISPYVGVSFVTMTPQTTWDVYARLGCLYYFDKPDTIGSDDFFGQSRAGVNLTHRFDERLRLTSRSFIAYELEPDYTQGFATSRNIGEYLYAQTDNALGYRWTERLASYTGFSLTELDYSDSDSSDRFTWMLYNQMRFQLNPEQTVLTFDYRYGQTNSGGLASDYTDQYLLVGLEHRFSTNTILIARAGAQLHEADGGGDNTSPYLELTLRSQINEQLMVRAFARYGMEVYDTVQGYNNSIYDFDQRAVLRLGVSGEYALSPMFTIFGGADYINAVNDDGRWVTGPGPMTADGLEQDLFNIYVGVSAKLNDNLYATLNYNYTDSTSDFPNQEYDRNRVSIGLRYEF
jgi:opacity protein-like surface antigen